MDLKVMREDLDALEKSIITLTYRNAELLRENESLKATILEQSRLIRAYHDEKLEQEKAYAEERNEDAHTLGDLISGRK